MGDTTKTNTNFVQRIVFRCGKNHYMREMGPFPRYCHMCVTQSFSHMYVTGSGKTGHFARKMKFYFYPTLRYALLLAVHRQHSFTPSGNCFLE